MNKFVKEIPALHPAYVSLGEHGFWNYWQKQLDGTYMWNPTWEVNENEKIIAHLEGLIDDWVSLTKEEKETEEKDRTTEWFQTISGKKLSLLTEIDHYRGNLWWVDHLEETGW